jgi:hypothetical protein
VPDISSYEFLLAVHLRRQFKTQQINNALFTRRIQQDLNEKAGDPLHHGHGRTHDGPTHGLQSIPVLVHFTSYLDVKKLYTVINH